MGYCGGTTENPTYENLGDHIETIQLEYDPEVVSYRGLLEIFFTSHSPEYNMRIRQYASAVFYHDEKQKRVAFEVLEQEQRKRGVKLYTLIMPYDRLYLAEPYHQKYYMQQVDILKKEIRSYYPEYRAFVDSTAAARINGYLKGWGAMERLQVEIGLLGLSEKGQKRLIEIVDSY